MNIRHNNTPAHLTLIQDSLNHKRPSLRATGFTLLEILIALFIFTIISLIMVGALHSVLTAQSRTENNARYFSEVQTTLTLLSRDLEQSINRQITNNSGGTENALVGTDSEISFTHAGLFNPFGSLNRSTLQRTHYFLKDGSLIRETWPTLDITSGTKSSDRKLVDQVTSLQFEYLDQNGKLQSSWPPPGQTQSILPHAVRVLITLQPLGTLTQFFLLPGYSNAPQN